LQTDSRNVPFLSLSEMSVSTTASSNRDHELSYVENLELFYTKIGFTLPDHVGLYQHKVNDQQAMLKASKYLAESLDVSIDDNDDVEIPSKEDLLSLLQHIAGGILDSPRDGLMIILQLLFNEKTNTPTLSSNVCPQRLAKIFRMALQSHRSVVDDFLDLCRPLISDNDATECFIAAEATAGSQFKDRDSQHRRIEVYLKASLKLASSTWLRTN
jgi:hypothetical protein